MPTQASILPESPKARLMTMAELRASILLNIYSKVPSTWTLRELFEKHHVRKFKANPNAGLGSKLKMKRGGGVCHYFVADVLAIYNNAKNLAA